MGCFDDGVDGDDGDDGDNNSFASMVATRPSPNPRPNPGSFTLTGGRSEA